MRKFYMKKSYMRAALGVTAGAVIGLAWLSTGAGTPALEENYIGFVKVIGPIIWCTLVCVIASKQRVEQIGRLIALIYSEFISAIALIAWAYVFELEYDRPLGSSPTCDD